jgi:hypothetical protein
MSNFFQWETEVYHRVWHLAYQAGRAARDQDLPRICNLEGRPFCHNDNILKPYKSAWEQGYDGTYLGLPLNIQ